VKICSKCKITKSYDDYYKNRARYDGYCNFCKICDKSKPINKERKLAYNTKYKQENAEKFEKYYKEYYKKNKDIYYKRCMKWARDNPERIKELWRSYYQTDEGRKRHCFQQAKRRAKQLNATPPWVDMEEIRKIYINCPPGYHVDHIIPLNHPLMSGLHVPWNLQYLTALENIRKNNKIEGIDVRL